MAKHVLVTGFEPFGGFKVNPSELVARGLEGRVVAGRTIAVRVLPVETRSLHDRLEALLAEYRPDIIVGTGLSSGLSALALERVGLNVLDFEAADNAGAMRTNEPIERGGPEARLTTLPLEPIVSSWNDHGVPGYVSNSAGTFLCNQFLYEILGLTANASPPILAGFVHLPCLPSQAIEAGPKATPSMSLDLMRRGIESLVETVVPWLEARPPEPRAKAPGSASSVWIPRGLKEVER